jgi:basic membrane lipoprotein Med (substrate-binding protein (PBP1-ABC) superfamily)
MRRPWWVAGSAAVVVLVGVLAAVFWPRGRALPPPRARVYTDASACLLTDSAGVGGAQAAPVWAGMQSASVRTRTKVSYLEVYGEDSVANAVPFVNTLVQRKCDLVIGVGASEVAAVLQQAATYPGVRFAVVGKGSGQNVTAIAPASADAVTGAADRVVGSITNS